MPYTKIKRPIKYLVFSKTTLKWHIECCDDGAAMAHNNFLFPDHWSPNGLHRVHYFLSYYPHQIYLPFVMESPQFNIYNVHNDIHCFFVLHINYHVYFQYSTTHTMYKLKCALGYLPTN